MAESSREEIAKLEALYASNPAGRVFTHLADAYRKAGELDRARGILEEGLAQHPGYASAHVVLGRVLMDLQAGNEAIDAFQRVLELDPHNMVALQSLAELTRASGRHEEALRYYQELRQHDPNSTEVEEAIAELTGTVALPAEPEAIEASIPGFAEATHAEGDTSPAWESDAETTSLPEQFAEIDAAFDREQQRTPEEPPQAEPAVAAAGDVAEDVELDWLASGPESERELGDLTALPSLEDEPDERTFDFADEIGDIGSLNAAGSEAEAAEAVPFDDLTLEAPRFDLAEPPREDQPGGELLTETIAELYRSQGLYDRAADVYRSLLRETPGDPGLAEKLQEVEALDRGETLQPEVAGQVDLPAWEPFLDEENEVAEVLTLEDDEPDVAAELAEAWLAGGAGTAESAPTPYAWAEQASEAPTDGGTPISAYFAGILAWQPRSGAVSEGRSVLAVAEDAEVISEVDEEPLLFLEETVTGQDAAVESASSMSDPQAPAEPSSEAMPWEQPVVESYGRPAIAPTPHEETAEAFDEWFGPAEGAAETEPAAPPSSDAEASLGEGDDDDDLEMFRSWLQSLKK